MRQAVLGLVMLLAASFMPARGQQVDTINSASIVAATTAAASDLACLNFSINGVCLYLVCTPFGCTVETSIQFRHFNPSLIVTSYNALDESPWEEIQAAFGTAQVVANKAQFAALGLTSLSLPGGGQFADETPVRSDRVKRRRANDLIFKNAEVIGAPGNALSLASTLGLPFFCPATDVAPLFPYFLSGLDALAWRSGVTELVFPASFIPGLREIGDFPLNTWGSVHPRQGFLYTTEDPKAGAVMAQRAADIATREFSPHVYVPVGSVEGLPDGGKEVIEPDPVIENDPTNSTWQMLAPVAETTCDVFGENDTADVFRGYSSNLVSARGDYAYALWRAYRCCEDLGTLIGTIEVQQ